MSLDPLSREGPSPVWLASQPEFTSQLRPMASRESRVAEAVALLPDNQQEVIRLRFTDGLSYKEIAEVTKLSVSNVGYLIHMGVKTLRERLKEVDTP